MNQSARFMWYHDHALGITRLNAYAGIASALLVRDDFEAGSQTKGLPPSSRAAGGNRAAAGLPGQDFRRKNIKKDDPTWTGLATTPGSLWYAHTYDPTGGTCWDGGVTSLPDPSVIPEFFADTMLVNGTAYPQAAVQARRYRLRLLNACNARWLNLQLYVDDGSPNGITLDDNGNPTNKPFINPAAGNTELPADRDRRGLPAEAGKDPQQHPVIPPGQPDPDTGQTDPSQS